MSPCTVLLIEDDADVAASLVQLFETVGVRATHAVDGASALDMLRRANDAWDVIVLDLMMPVMNGWQFRVEQRKHPAIAAIPVVVLSANRSPEASAIDAEAFFSKPIDFSQLASTVQRLALGREVERSGAALRASEQRLNALLASVHSVVAEYDCADGRCTGLWPAGDDAAVQPSLASHVGDANAPRMLETIRRVCASGTPETAEFSIELNGETRWFVADVARAPRCAGAAPTAVVSRRDVTDLRQIRERLQISERLASIGTLAAGVAHEINNPLAYISSNVSFALSELQGVGDRVERLARDANDLEPIAREVRARFAPMIDALRDALDGTSRVHRIVRDLNTFSHNADDNREVVDVAAIVDAALSIAHGEIRHRARIVRQYAAVPPVSASSGKLGQLVLNLIVNAAQAIPFGASESNTITVRLFTSTHGELVLEVIDTGVGIAPEVMPRIFDPFFTTKPVGVGTGLGLAISHAIATGLGGTIAVESVLGDGSTFRVTLPASEAFDSLPPPALPTDYDAGDATTRRARVLVIDDEPTVVRATRRMLRGEYDVEIAPSGRDAFTLLERDRAFDVILCDVMMRDGAGIALFENVRASWPELSAKFAFMTGGVFTPHVARFLDTVDNPRIAKPFSIDDFKRAVPCAASSHVDRSLLDTPRSPL